MPFLTTLSTILSIYWWVVFIGVVLSLLLQFNVINGSNQLVQTIYGFCRSLSEPLLNKIRRFVRPINGIDLSPLVLLLAIELVNRSMMYYLAPRLVMQGL